MDDWQRHEAAIYLAGWLDKMSVGCFLAGFFNMDHVFGGIIGGTILFLAGISIKLRAR